MKRLLVSIITALSVVIGTSGAMAAANANVEVKNDVKSVTYSYTALAGTRAENQITKLFEDIKKLNSENPNYSEDITIISKSADGLAVDFSLKMEDNTSGGSSEDNTILSLCSVKIKDADGNDVTGTDSANITTDGDKAVIELPLGRQNTQFTKDEKKYTVEFSLNSGLTDKQITNLKENLAWGIISAVPRVSASTVTPAPTNNTTVEATPTPSASATPGTSVSPQPTATASAGTKVKYVGENKDIVPGKYVTTGNGAIKVYNSQNALKTEVTLKDDNHKNSDGADSVVLNLADGDRVEFADYIKLTPQSTKATATPKASAKATAKAKATATAKTKAKATATPKAKTNPKTGDTAPIAAVSFLAVAALGACLYIEYLKKNKN